MSSDHERQNQRYPLRLAIKLHHGSNVLDADVINASANGCLLLSVNPLEPGMVLEASIPELLIPRTRLHIVRCHSTQSGYMVAAYFDAAMTEEAQFARHTGEQQTTLAHLRWLN